MVHITLLRIKNEPTWTRNKAEIHEVASNTALSVPHMFLKMGRGWREKISIESTPEPGTVLIVFEENVDRNLLTVMYSRKWGKTSVMLLHFDGATFLFDCLLSNESECS